MTKTKTHELELIPAQQSLPPGQLAAIQPQAGAGTPLALLQYAMANGGASLDQLERLMDMQRKYEADEARKAYVDDMAKFKMNPPTIIKDKRVSFKTGSGKTEYDHATIGNVTAQIVKALAQHGFSHSWVPEQRDGMVIVTCTITHRLGHKESVTLQAAPDASGGKNGIQSIISAQTYLQRHTLLAATGLATHDQQDDDGAGYSTDTALADEWITKLAECQDDAAVVALWAPAVQAFAKDRLGLKEFEEAFVARRAALQGGVQ